MVDLNELTAYLDTELRLAEIPDYSGALNGLQIENNGKVSKVVAAVDASLAVFEKAVAVGADLLVVHHGMFWQGAQPVTGAVFKKIKMALDHNMALYSAHIPLDVHPQWGNNIQLATKLGMLNAQPFFDWKGIKLGVCEKLDVDREDFQNRLSVAVNGHVHLCPGGREQVGRVGVITGGAGSEIAAMAKCGIDTFVTGEGPHWSYPLAEELGINLFYAGHYATETLGVKVLVSHLSDKFGLEGDFIHHPTGL